MVNLSSRTVNFVAFLLACLTLVIALYLEIHAKLEPCPLCVIQRMIFLGLALLFLICGLIDPQSRAKKMIYLFTFMVAVTGMLVAGRHIWLQNLSSKILGAAPACGASLNYLFKVLPASEAFRLIFAGSGDCAKVTWSFFGITLPELAIILYAFLGIAALWQAFRE